VQQGTNMAAVFPIFSRVCTPYNFPAICAKL